MEKSAAARIGGLPRAAAGVRWGYRASRSRTSPRVESGDGSP